MRPHHLTTLFKPQSIAVFGASEEPGAVGTALFENILKGGFSGPVYPVNPKYRRVRGIHAYSALSDVGAPVDLAVIATPAGTVPGIMDAMGQHGTRAAVVLSAGFRELGVQGKQLEDRVLARARRHGIRILGPNCLGLIRADLGLNATLSKSGAARGGLALVSQSGALCTAVLDWAEHNSVGFSSVVSTGNSADIDFGEILDFLIWDPATRSILLYVEGIHSARRFISALRAAARAKPVIVMKTGRHMEGSRAVLSHTGALVGEDDIFDAAFRRAGAVRVLNFANLFGAAKTLSSGLRTQGRRLAIVTNGGGTGVMAADRLVDKGLPVVGLADQTIALLDRSLPSGWSRNNPVDIMGDAPPERYRIAASACLRDPGVDALLAILTPQAMTDADAVAGEMVGLAQGSKKPLLTCWMGEAQVEASRRLFSEHQVPTYRTPEAAVDAFHLLATFHHNQQLLLQVPEPLVKEYRPDLGTARTVIDRVLGEGRDTLSEVEARIVLSAFRVPVPRTVQAASAEEARVRSREMRYPLIMRVDTPDIGSESAWHDLSLVIASAEEFAPAFESLSHRVQEGRLDARHLGVLVEELRDGRNLRALKVGVIRGPVFGPAIVLSPGGSMSEIVSDRAVALPPLNAYLARNLIQSSCTYRALLHGANSGSADLQALEDVLVRVSEMVCALPAIRELEVDPLIVDARDVTAGRCRISVETPPAQVQPYAHMAIHPYPAELISGWRTSDGEEVTIRPIRPEDAVIEREFVHALSSRSKYFRFMYALEELTPEMLSRFTQIDYDREMALIAVTEANATSRQIGVGRYVINPDGESCEFAIVVADEYQNKGVGSRLMLGLIESARHKGLKTMTGEVLRENQNMRRFVGGLGFASHASEEDYEIMEVTKRL